MPAKDAKDVLLGAAPSEAWKPRFSIIQEEFSLFVNGQQTVCAVLLKEV